MDEIDAEIDAIKTILSALKSLDPKTRQTVMDYVTKRLDLNSPAGATEQTASTQKPAAEGPKERKDGAPHIKDLKEEKQPGSNVEMAVLVAYYLSELAEEGKRKETVTAQDLDTYFKIASYPKPAAFKDVLKAAKNGGYMDSADRGKYKLNAVGYNLAVHTLPRNKSKS